MSQDLNWRIDHTGVGVGDIRASARFYDAVLGSLGLRPLMRITTTFGQASGADDPDLAGVGYGRDYPIFWIDLFHPAGVRQHTAFRAISRAEVEAFHRSAIEAGGRDNGAPGLRTGGYPSGYFAAFVFDPDGNNIEAVFREA
ncbi:VOC family protein [Caulobacter sp. 73W]|uniref:VOC family protein n=1 Tax=Caulobacter sp. 73W TaxID=3161137 RepID=A0AB39KU94_9CAUL